jgi:four helix bundle protein
MTTKQEKITTFTQLRTWQKASDLVVAIYEITKLFPKDELFSLTSQIRRSAVSVPSNIAEGFSRASAKDKAHFYVMSLGSLTETLNHVYISQKLSYISSEEVHMIETEITDLNKMLNGMIKSARGRNT